MKALKIILFIAIILSSCTEVIDINVQKSTPEIVIEANIALNHHAEVLVSKSIQLTDSNVFIIYDNASVKISDNDGNFEMLDFDPKSGKFIGNELTGKTGKTYTLHIDAGDKAINGTSVIPSAVKIDSMWVVNSIYPGAGKAPASMEANFYEVNVKFNDPANELNYYRILVFVNNIPLSGNNIYNDKYTNGLENEKNIVFYNKTMKNGDLISVELQSLDKNVFNYFQSMGNASMRGGTASPANPYTNLEGTKLGFFSAHSNDIKSSILVK